MTKKMQMLLRLGAACAAFALLTACSEKPAKRSLADELCKGGPLVAADFGDRPDAAALARKENEDCAARKAAK